MKFTCTIVVAGTCMMAGKTAAASANLAALDAASYVIEPPGVDDDQEVTAYNPVVIAETTTAFRRLSVAEAVMELDLTGVPAMVFLHATSGRINVIYRRPDGNVGWVDPPVVKA